MPNNSQDNQWFLDNIATIHQQFTNFSHQFAKLFAELTDKQGDSSEDSENDGEQLVLLWLAQNEKSCHSWSEHLKRMLKLPEPSFRELMENNREGLYEIIRQAFSLSQNIIQSEIWSSYFPHPEISDELFDPEHFIHFLKLAEMLSDCSVSDYSETNCSETNCSESNRFEPDWQNLLPLFYRYRRAGLAYGLIMVNNGLLAGETFRKQLDGSLEDKPSKDISSLKELYHFWLEINESVYARVAMSPEYQQAYAELVNSQMAFKYALDHFYARQAKLFNLISRGEMDGLLESQLRLKRENKKLRQMLYQMAEKIERMEDRYLSEESDQQSSH